MLKLEPGQIVELSREGRKTFDRKSPKAKNRTTGEVLGRSTAYPDCYRVKWRDRKSVDMIHHTFLKAVIA